MVLFSGEHTRIKKSGVNAKSNSNLGSFLLLKKHVLIVKLLLNLELFVKIVKKK